MDLITLDSVIINVLFFAGGLALLISLCELFVRVRRPENYLFCILMFSFGILMFQIGFICNGTVLRYPLLFSFHLTFLYLVGPIGYFAYYLIILPRDTLPARMFLSLLPTVTAVVFDAHYLLLPHEGQKLLLTGLVSSAGTAGSLLTLLLFAGAGVQIILYLSNLLFRFMSIWTREGHARVLLVSMVYLVYTIVASTLEISGYVLGTVGLAKWGGFMMALLFLSAFITSQRFPRFLQLIIDEAEKKYRAKSLITGINIDETILKLKDCMLENKMYMNDGLTLKDLAGEVSMTSHQLSQLLNERLATNFNNFVNQYRINEAKEILLNEPERSVISIAYAVGFNTKSSFYYAFSRFTGKTPQDYRRENL